MIREDTVETLFYKQEWEQELDVLLHHLFRKNFLVGIKGEKFVGKTTFANYLAPHLTHEQQVSFLTLTGKETISDFLHKLLLGLGIEKFIPDYLSVPEQLRAFLILLHNQERSFVIIVDNTELASNEILSAIVALLKAQGDKNVFLRFILVGHNVVDERLRLVLEHYQKQVQFYCTALKPLSRQEVIKFLKFAFSNRISDQLLLQKRFIDLVYEKTGGLPGRIAALMKTSWLDDYQKKQNHRKSPQFLTVVRTFGAMIAALVILNISYFISQYAETPKLQLPWFQPNSFTLEIKKQELRILMQAKQIFSEALFVAEPNVKMLQQQNFFISPFYISSHHQIEKRKLKTYPVSKSIFVLERFPGMTAIFSPRYQKLVDENKFRFLTPPTILAKQTPEIISIRWVNGTKTQEVNKNNDK